MLNSSCSQAVATASRQILLWRSSLNEKLLSREMHRKSLCYFTISHYSHRCHWHLDMWKLVQLNQDFWKWFHLRDVWSLNVGVTNDLIKDIHTSKRLFALLSSLPVPGTHLFPFPCPSPFFCSFFIRCERNQMAAHPEHLFLGFCWRPNPSCVTKSELYV